MTAFDESNVARDASGKFAPSATSASSTALTDSELVDSALEDSALGHPDPVTAIQQQYRSAVIDPVTGWCKPVVVNGVDVANTDASGIPQTVRERLLAAGQIEVDPPRWGRTGGVKRARTAQEVAALEASGGRVERRMSRPDPSGARRGTLTWQDAYGSVASRPVPDGDLFAPVQFDLYQPAGSDRDIVTTTAVCGIDGNVYLAGPAGNLRVPGPEGTTIETDTRRSFQISYDADGRWHSTGDQPAVWADDEMEWRAHGLLHREHGPARVGSDGSVLFARDGDVIDPSRISDFELRRFSLERQSDGTVYVANQFYGFDGDDDRVDMDGWRAGHRRTRSTAGRINGGRRRSDGQASSARHCGRPGGAPVAGN